MKPLFFALFCALSLLSASAAWPKDRSLNYPNYEPPRLEELPASREAPPPEKPRIDWSEIPAAEEAPEPVAEQALPEAPPAAPLAPADQEYVVWIWQESGDSLSQIAGKMYGDPQKWRLIYLANKNDIKDPNRIYPKQKLKIPPADWQP